jgi:exodeoxyribonuclease V alpha subunit
VNLEDFCDADALAEGDLLLARRLAGIAGESRDGVVLAAATCLAELRRGAVCLVLDDPPALQGGSPPAWPDPQAWLSTITESTLVQVGAGAPARPLRLVGGRLYLQRFWQDEEVIRSSVTVEPDTTYPQEQVERAVATVFGDGARPAAPEQREAARVAARSRITLLAGGPGTGKTWTVARILAVLAELAGQELRMAVAAPTGKAATRLQEALATESPAAAPDWVRSVQPSTIHRLLRRRPGTREAFRHNRDNPLPLDVLIVDEMSMVSLPLMARLMEAVGPTTRLILVGDPNQLASVEAGAVFGDLVRMRSGGDGLVTLRENYRFTGQLQRLADAVREGRADDAIDVLRPVAAGDAGNVTFIDTEDGRAAFPAVRDDVVAQSSVVEAAARAGDAPAALDALSDFRVLCAHRLGPAGVARWSSLIDRWSAGAGHRRTDGDDWYPGRPLLVTRNDYDLRIFNGETGVVVERDGRTLAVIDQGEQQPAFAPTQLNDVETLHAMTVHKAQGSQYRRVTVVLPPADSPLLTRELLYTAITRAQEEVRIVGTEEAVRTAVSRGIRRASGLGQ